MSVLRTQQLGRWRVELVEQAPWMKGNQMNYYVRVLEAYKAGATPTAEHEVVGSITRTGADTKFDVLVEKYTIIMAGEVLSS